MQDGNIDDIFLSVETDPARQLYSTHGSSYPRCEASRTLKLLFPGTKSQQTIMQALKRDFDEAKGEGAIIDITESAARCLSSKNDSICDKAKGFSRIFAHYGYINLRGRKAA
jgi:hypothetical protein